MGSSSESSNLDWSVFLQTSEGPVSLGLEWPSPMDTPSSSTFVGTANLIAPVVYPPTTCGPPSVVVISSDDDGGDNSSALASWVQMKRSSRGPPHRHYHIPSMPICNPEETRRRAERWRAYEAAVAPLAAVVLVVLVAPPKGQEAPTTMTLTVELSMSRPLRC